MSALTTELGKKLGCGGEKCIRGYVLENSEDEFKGNLVNAVEIVHVTAGTEDELKVSDG
jgi:hypothetical protein